MENTPKLQPGLTMKLFKEKADMALDEIFSHFPPPRILTFPQYLTYYVASFINDSTKSKHNVSIIPMNNIPDIDYDGSMFFVTTADTDSINQIIFTFNKVKKFDKVVLVIPRVTELIQYTFSQTGYNINTTQILDKKDLDPTQVYLYDFAADFLPMGDDFFLLPSINSFYKISILSDYEDIYNSAKALFSIENVFGNIPHIMCAGINALRVQQVLSQFHSTPSKVQIEIPQIDSLIIIDRCVDLVTPLTTELSIEGIINAAFDIQYSKVNPNIENINSPVILKEHDEVFRTIRMMSFNRMINYTKKFQELIEEKAREIKQDGAMLHRQGNFGKKYEEAMHLVEDLTIKLENFFKISNEGLRKLKQKTPAFEEIYTKEFQLIQDFQTSVDLPENLVLLYNDWANALRLICLQSVCGFKKMGYNDTTKIMSEIINEFGLEKAREGLLNLDKIRFLSNAEFDVSLAECLYKLDIFGPVDKDNNPTDSCGTAFGGYVPPSVRFVQKFTNGEIDQLVQDFSEKIKIAEFGKSIEREHGDQRRIIVFFVGGLTLTEAGTIRNIGRTLYNGEVEYIVGGTDKISYNTFLQQLCPFLRD